jgi:hypothetical protein
MKNWQYGVGAIATKITFDEVAEGTAVDGLNIKGVTFDYKVFGEDSDGAYTTNFGADLPPLDGNALLLNNGNSVLTLDFNDPISVFKFDADWICTFGESCDSPNPAYTVKLFDGGLNQLSSYADGNVKRVVFEFNPDKVEEFAIDNLTFNSVGNPEPATILGTLALGGLGLSRLKKARR